MKIKYQCLTKYLAISLAEVTSCNEANRNVAAA
jgi:hypothetical protein